MTFLEIALSGFWAFTGTLIIIGLIGHIAAIMIIGGLESWRKSKFEIVSAVREAIDDGKLDGAISRVISRNKKRNGD